MNDAVLRAVAFYQFRIPMAFAAALKRRGRYLDLMRGILKEEGVPQDLVYVAMVESAFKYQAHSRAAAHGFWQFIAGTGKRYGLKRNRALDERSDPVKSTRAAAAYFRDLYEMFGDWHLAMAAYDAGEGRILRSLQRTGARDFWELAAGTRLRRETRDYVPFILATALIAKDPARFGFDVVPDPPLAWDAVTVRSPSTSRASPSSPWRRSPTSSSSTASSRRARRPMASPRTASASPRDGRPSGGPSRRAPGCSRRRREARRRQEGRDAADGRDPRGRVRGRAVRLERPPEDRPKKGMVLVVPGIASKGATRSARLRAPAPQGEIRGMPTPAAAITRAADVGPFTAVPPTTVAGQRVRRSPPARVDIPR